MPTTIRFARYPGQSARIIFAPLFIAQDRGFFADEGLRVEIIEPEDHPWQSVSRGEADIGVGYIDYCARPEFFGRIKAVAVQERLVPGRGLPALLARTELIDSGALRTEAGMRGAKIGLTWGRGDDYLTYFSVLERAGLTLADVSCVPVPHEGARRQEALANRELDILIGRRPRQIVNDEKLGALRRWKVGSEIQAGWQNRFFVYAQTFIDAGRAPGIAFLRAHQRAVDVYLAGTPGGSPAAEFLPYLAGISEEAPELLLDVQPAAFPSDCAIDMADVFSNVQKLKAVDLFPPAIGIHEIIDAGFTDQLTD